MELNRLIFPAPEASYDIEDFEEELLWVPNMHQPRKPAVPCMLLRDPEGSSKLLIYYHGNAEDLGLAWEIMTVLRNSLNVHVLGVEYPGYGVYPGKPSAKQILEDSKCVIEFLTVTLGYSSSNIIVFGRSIGSGPATFLAKETPVCMLVLMAAYTSIKDVVKNIAGRLAKMAVAQRFQNLENIKGVFCPTFIVHGLKDNLIPYSHAQRLHEQCPGLSQLLLPQDMDHNFFRYYEDLVAPLEIFMQRCGIDTGVGDGDTGDVSVPSGFFQPPPGQPPAQNNGKMHKLMTKFKN